MPLADLDRYPLIDDEMLASRKVIATAILPKLIAAFSKEVPKTIGLLKKSYEANEHAKMKTLGHKLKGMCVNLGASKLSELGRIVEEDEYKDFIAVYSAIITVFQQTMTELNRHILA